MQIQSKIPAFKDVSYLLSQVNSQTTPSEIHGVLCGFICAGQRLDGKFWLDALFKRFGFLGQLMPERQEIILNIYDTACRQLMYAETEDMFRLLLPEETSPLYERAQSLSEWCQGFLYGLGLVGNLIDEHTHEDVCEAMRCITEIAKLDFEKIEIDEMDQIAYLNVLEFVETSTVVIYKHWSDQSKSLH